MENVAQDKRGVRDLCAYFFLKASQLVQKNGMCGLLATNTIAQGDSREVGLDQILRQVGQYLVQYQAANGLEKQVWRLQISG